MSKHTLTTLSQPAPTEAEQQQMGEEITAQYHAAELAQLEIITLGAMLAQVEEMISAERGTDTRLGGIAAKGKGLKGWLARYAPEVAYSNARRYRDIAQQLVRKFSLKSAERLELITSSGVDELDPKLRKKRAEVVKFVSEKSVRAMQLELGLIGGGADDGDDDEGTSPKKKATPAERHAAAIAAARERALQAFSTLHILGPRWKLLEDKLLRQALMDTEALAKELRTWLAVPAHDRAAFDLPAYLASREKQPKADA